MNTCAELFIANLESKHLTYDVKELGDETLVAFPYDGRRTNFVFAGDQGDHAQMQTIIERVPDDKFIDVVLACNQINAEFRYVKFAVDKDNDVMVFTDAILDPSTAGEECFELLIRSLKIISDAKPIIMKAIYG